MSVATSLKTKSVAVPLRAINMWLTLGVLLVFSLHTWLYRNFSVDDTFIAFRFVQQWAAGNGIVYNIGEYVEGYSSFIWILLLLPFKMLGFDLLSVARTLGFICSIATLLVLNYHSRNWKISGISMYLLIASAPFVVWSTSGMETALYTFLVTLSILQFTNEEEQHSGWFSGIYFALVALTRPEGLMFGGLAGLFRLVAWVRTGKWPTKDDWLRFGILSLIVGAYLGWRLYYYGYLLPNTVYAKSTGLHLRTLLEGIYYILQSLPVIGGPLGVGVFACLALTDPKLGKQAQFLAACVGLTLLFIVLTGGDWMPFNRFIVPILPVVFLLVHTGLNRLAHVWPHRFASAIIILLVIGNAGYWLASSFAAQLLLLKEEPQIATDKVQPEDYVATHLKAGDTIAVIDAGEIAYRAPLTARVVDMVGLTDEHIAHLPAQFPGGLWGRGDAFGKWDVDYVLAQNPKYVQLRITETAPDGSWQTNFTGTTQLVNDPRFRQAYQLVTETVSPSIFVLRASVEQ